MRQLWKCRMGSLLAVATFFESDVVQPTGPYGSFGSTSFDRIVVVIGRLVF